MSESDKTDRNKGKSKSKNKKKSGCSWALRVFLLAVALSALLSFFSSTALEGTGYAVVGDICGIVSGSTAAVIVVELQRDLSTTSILISIAVTALISGITIGGKALGKTVAINECTGVVYRVARLMHTLHLYR